MKTQNYKIEFWYGTQAEWRPCTLKTFTDLDEAKAYKKAQQEMCNYMVDFRILEGVA